MMRIRMWQRTGAVIAAAVCLPAAATAQQKQLSWVEAKVSAQKESPILTVRESSHGAMAFAVITAEDPWLPATAIRAWSRLTGSIDQNGGLVNLRGTGGYKMVERYTLAMVKRWYRPGKAIGQHPGEIEIEVRFKYVH